jgi:uncharacterized protein YjdB
VVGTLVVSVVANIVTSVLIVGPTSLPAGQTSQLTVSASNPGGSQVVTSGVTWQSSKPAVATVSSAGVLSALSAGTTTITATYGGTSGTLAVTVINETVTAIALYGNPALTSAVTNQFTATATLAGGSSQVVTSLATWQSSNPAVATVSSAGLVTWVAAGTTTITATYLGTTGSVVITAT